MAIQWCSVEDGNDTTGDGSYANPYKTPNKCITVASASDEIRLKATSTHATITAANFSFTDNSATVTTDADTTSIFSVGNYIGKTTAGGNGARETFHRIASINATTITLQTNYFGDTETVSSVLSAYIANTGESQYILLSDTVLTSNVTPLYVTAGWNTSATQAGETFVTHNGTFGQYGLNNNNNSNGVVSVDRLNAYNIGLAHLDLGNINYTNSTLYLVTNNPFLANDVIRNCTVVCSNGGLLADNSNLQAYDCNLIFKNARALDKPSTVYSIAITGCNFFGAANIYNPVTYWRGTVFTDNNIYHATSWCWVNSTSETIIIENCYFYNCYGIAYPGSVVAGFWARNCTFEACTYLFYVYRSPGMIYLENCTVSGLNQGFYGGDQYTSPTITLANCDFYDVTNYTINTYSGIIGPIQLLDCTWDVSSSSKVIYDPDNANNNAMNLPLFILQNCNTNGIFPNGAYYTRFNLTQDDVTFRTSTPSLKLVNKATLSYELPAWKLFSTYVQSGSGKQISFYHRENSGWTGEIKFYVYLNGAEIKRFPSDTISTLSTSWSQISLPISGSEILNDGELAVFVQHQGNTIQANFDDFAVGDIV